MIEATFENIAVAGEGTHFLVLLRTKNNDILPIAIDALQAHAIAAGRAQEKFPRPLTHDLMLSMLELLGAEVKRIEVTDLREGTYYARLILDNRGIEFELDARPSDALALAVRVDAPLLIAQKVIDMAALGEFEGGPGGVEA